MTIKKLLIPVATKRFNMAGIPEESVHQIEDVGNILLSVQKELEIVRKSIEKASATKDRETLNPMVMYDHHSKVIQRAEVSFKDKAEAVLKSVIDHTPVTIKMDDKMSVQASSTFIASRLETDFQFGNTRVPNEDILAPFRHSVAPSVVNNKNIKAKTIGESSQKKKGKIFKSNPAISSKSMLDSVISTSKNDSKNSLFHLSTSGKISSSLSFNAFNDGITNKPVQFNSFHSKFEKKSVSPFVFQATIDIKMPETKIASKVTEVENIKVELTNEKNSVENIEPDTSVVLFESNPNEKKTLTVKTQKLDLLPVALPTIPMPMDVPISEGKQRDYDTLLDEYSLHQFIIRKGKSVTTTPEFVSFRRKYAHVWGSVKRIITFLEEFLQKYNVLVAFTFGSRVAELATDYFYVPTVDDLLSCFQNRENVEDRVQNVGCRFAGYKPEEKAAILIQSFWRMYITKKLYRYDLKRHRAARLIQLNFRLYINHKRTKIKIAQIFAAKLAAWRQLMTEFKIRWHRIVRKRRVIIHIPSYSYSSYQRLSIHNLEMHENTQLTRLCSIMDPSVDVIYVSPIPVSDDLKLYYLKLFEVAGIKNAASRVKILHPENFNRFSNHLSLAQKLYYSPKCLKRILQQIRNREAYIVPGHVGQEDLLVAIALNLPILGAEPEVIKSIGSKSNAKRLFSSASVNILPGTSDIKSPEDLISSLVYLILKQCEVQRWIIKLEDEFGGRGIAYFDVAKLKSIENFRIERRKNTGIRSNELILSPYADTIKLEVEAALPVHMHFTHPHIYDWIVFAKRIVSVGCMIEACPPSIVGSPSANIFIEPDGTCHLMSTNDQIFTNNYAYIGATFPQQTISNDIVLAATMSIGKACFQKGIIGYVGVDFIVSNTANHQTDSDEQTLRMFAVDLNLRVSDTFAGYLLFDFLLQGKTRIDGTYMIDRKVETEILIPDQDSETTESHSFVANTRRYFTIVNYVSHHELSSIQFRTFFNICRLKGISFDLESKEGIAMMLMDNLIHGTLGILSVGESSLKSTVNCLKALEFLQDHVSVISSASELSITESNIKELCLALRSVLKSTRVNEK